MSTYLGYLQMLTTLMTKLRSILPASKQLAITQRKKPERLAQESLRSGHVVANLRVEVRLRTIISTSSDSVAVALFSILVSDRVDSQKKNAVSLELLRSSCWILRHVGVVSSINSSDSALVGREYVGRIVLYDAASF